MQLVIGYHEIFKKKAETVSEFNAELCNKIDKMFDILYHENGVGLGANMVGLLERIAIVDLQEKEHTPLTLINPVITFTSLETQTFEEASLSFPGISAKITRPEYIELEYDDQNGVKQELSAKGYLSTVIQHEVDYLNGTTFLDYLSPLRKKMLLKKLQKNITKGGIKL